MAKKSSFRSKVVKSQKEYIPVVSLFCGAGGLDSGFRKAGYFPLAAIDVDEPACETYYANHTDTPGVLRIDLQQETPKFVAGIIRKIGGDVYPLGVIGGPPCQSFSQGNTFKRKGDPRSRLPQRFSELVKELNRGGRLDFFVFENVSGLLYKKHKFLYGRFMAGLRRAGFKLFEVKLNAWWFGVPQDRARVFVVGFNERRFKGIRYTPPSKTHAEPLSAGKVLKGLGKPTFFRRGLLKASNHRHPNHWCMFPKSKKFQNGYLLANGRDGRSFRVIDPKKPSPTVAYGHNEVNVHPNGKRRLSIYEAMLLQGFSKRYRLKGLLTQQIKQVSNAVPPALAKALAISVRDAIANYRSDSK